MDNSARFRLRTLGVGVLLLVTTGFFHGTIRKRSEPPEDLPGLSQLVDSVMRAGMASEKIPGAAVLIIHRGRIAIEKGYGFADVASRQPVDPRTTLWPFASITKVFTATAVAQLAARGQIDLNEDANRYLRGVRIPDSRWKPVTVAQLLSHTDALDEVPGRRVASREELLPLEQFLRGRLVRIGAPGIVTRYGSYGIALAGVLVQDVSGIRYEEFVARNILEPLVMRHSSLGPRAGETSSVAVPYVVNEGKVEPVALEWYHTTPTSSLVSTVDDMSRFISLHLGTPLTRTTEKVLPPRWIREMARQHATIHPSIPGWGYGWQQANTNGERIIEHGGDIGGFASLLTLLPERQLGFVVVSHVEGSSLRFKLRQAILDRYFPDKRAPVKGTALPRSELTRYTGTYVANNYCRSCEGGATTAQHFDIVAADDGSLELWGDRWRQVEPLGFSSSDGRRRIGFMQDSSGAIVAVSGGAWRVLERAPPR